MKTALVGYTGFVGGNLEILHNFENKYNSKNIIDAFNTNPDLLIYSGVPAAKFLANSNAQADFDVCMDAFENIKKINPKKLVLISTVDVYKNPINVNEDTKADIENEQAYGRNRALLEKEVQNKYNDALIVRLPGLYGKGLKKNFLYDFLTLTPSMLKKEKYEELAQKNVIIKNAYELQDNGFYALTQKAKTEDKNELRSFFKNNDFNALYFTHSQAFYQFYNLNNLWEDINTALNNGLTMLNIATEPVSAFEIYEKLTNGMHFKNEFNAQPAYYDMQTKHAKLFNKTGPYLYTKQEVLNDICNFIEKEKCNY